MRARNATAQVIRTYVLLGVISVYYIISLLCIPVFAGLSKTHRNTKYTIYSRVATKFVWDIIVINHHTLYAIL